MALAPVGAKEEVEKTGRKVTLTAPRGPRVKKLSEPEATGFKGLLFGPTGSGKTYAIVGLLLHGFKVFVISTDLGGEGLASVELALLDMGRADLLENCIGVVLSNYNEVTGFLNNPASIYPEIYTDGIDWLVWDGFTGFQQNVLGDYIGDMTPERSGGKDISDARESGLQFEQQDWGMVRNGTTRNLDKFLKLNNLKSGQVWHKLVTCLEELKPVKSASGTTYQETREPMLQGSAKKLILPAFDLILNTRIQAGESEASKRAFKYVCAGHDSLQGAKTRGLKLEPVEDGDMFKLWAKIAEQKKIKQGAVNEAVKE